MLKRCPGCGRKYTGREIYCSRCASLLEFEENRCSTQKTELCRTAHLTKEDRYCPYCASPTTYALEMIDGEW